MKSFLKETWELWYWAMFFPSKLQQRMNEWSPQKERETVFSDILIYYVNWRFVGQFLLIVSLFNLPLLRFLFTSSLTLSWILLPTALFSAYGVAFLLLPAGLHVPLLFSLVYGVVPQVINESLLIGLQTWQESFPSLARMFLGIATGSIMLGLNSAGTYILLVRNRLEIAKSIFMIGSSVAIFTGGWISTHSWLFAALSGIASIYFSYLFRDRLRLEKKAGVVAGVVVVGVTGSLAIGVIGVVTDIVASVYAAGITGFVASVIAVAFTGVIMGVFAGMSVRFVSGIVSNLVPLSTANPAMGIITSVVAGTVAISFTFGVASIVASTAAVSVSSAGQLPLAVFLIATALISFSCSYTCQRWLGWWLSASLINFGFERLGPPAFLVVPVALIFYYRIVPEYLFSAPIVYSSIFSFLNRKKPRDITSQQAADLLRRLPPFSSELLWLAIPRHETLLARVFHGQPSFGLQVMQSMQNSPLIGLQCTAQKALPIILTDQFSSFRDIASLRHLLLTPEYILTDNPETLQFKRLLKVLLPNFHVFPLDGVDNTSSLPAAELTVILPRLRNIAQDTDAALQANNLALQERGLENVLKRLEILPSQLPSLGLNTQEIQRWNPVIQRWQNILTLELAEQKKRSQGELLNPFQYGNPLQRSRADLFKGRQTFAENIVRILLDRNRPTIVLHGPRRCGKTSFLNNLPRLLPSQWIPVFVDAQSSATTTDEAAFCQTLVRAIIRDARIQGIKFSASPTRAEFLSAPYITLENWLQIALEGLKKADPDKRLLLTIDEFEKIGTAMDAGKLSTDLFDELRSLIQHWDQLGFVFSGVQTLSELGPNWSSYFISVVPVEMLYLEPNEARELLINPDPDFCFTYAPGVINEILQLTQCHPNLVQLIGAALVFEANERHSAIATPEMLQAAIPRAFTLGTSYFENVWLEFTGNPQNPAEVQSGQTILKALSQGIQPPTDADELTKSALRRMERYHVLKVEAGQYAFDIPLIQRWVKERAILE